MINTSERVWLRRFANRSYSRPMTEAELMELIQSGAMNPTDELCAANDYWFSVQDVLEMRKHFGNISMDGMFRKIKEEVTEERMADTARIVVSELKGNVQNQPLKSSRIVTIDQPEQKPRSILKIVFVILVLSVLVLLLKVFS
jgi:hypothetical protein